LVVPRKIETDQGDRDHYPLTGECTAEAGSNVHLFGQESNGRSSTGIYPIMFRGIECNLGTGSGCNLGTGSELQNMMYCLDAIWGCNLGTGTVAFLSFIKKSFQLKGLIIPKN
jgi:hypothetical protein